MLTPGSGALSFGLRAIPVKLHTANDDQSVSFNLFQKKCASRLRSRWHRMIGTVRAASFQGYDGPSVHSHHHR
jgi:non-homologous end joining protein Ku